MKRIRSRIAELLEQEELYRNSVINLQASENVLSPEVKRALATDLASRYSHIDQSGKNSYGGARFAERILAETTDLAKGVYGSEYAEVRPVGGHIAALASLLAVTRRGDTIMAIGERNGGYPGYGQSYIPDLIGVRTLEIPYDADDQQILYDALQNQVRKNRVAAIVLGQSAIVRPYDLRAIRDIVDDSHKNTRILYDGSHVMGLIPGRQFQPDALELSDILYGSTHKSFYGPQGGLILTNQSDLYEKIEKQLVWKTMDNYHPNRVAALGVALEEFIEGGVDYAALVVENSRKLARALYDLGVGVRFHPWYSHSHQILLDPGWLSSMGLNFVEFSHLLEKNRMIVDRDGRLGTSEISHLGVRNVLNIAKAIKGALEGVNINSYVDDVLAEAKGGSHDESI